jgi:hypothetical protein
MVIGIFGPEYLQFSDGGPAAEVRIFIFMPDTKTKAVLYSDRNGVYTAPNPLYTDRRGELVFFAEVGEYDLYYEFLEPTGTTVRISIDSDDVPPSEAMGYKHIQSTSVNAVSITHGLSFAPAGILCLDNSGVQVEQDRIAQPAPGVTEVFFGVGYQFAGIIYLS